MDWKTIREYVARGQVFRACTAKQVLAAGAYLNLRLHCPSGASKTLELVDLLVSGDQDIWGQIRTNATISGTPAGLGAVNALVGQSISAVGTAAASTDGTMGTGGTIYETHRIPVHRAIDNTEDSLPVRTWQPLRLGAGNKIDVCYGPMTVTTSVAVGFTWLES